jgi:8-oxo-dGTP pyrophosphatase MutT (NUDIX family)
MGLATRHAAVAALLRESEHDLEVLLIQRASRAGDPWSGHIALPGGHAQPTDSDLLATALRETHEEIGVDLARGAELLGRLSDLQPASGGALNVRPYCFAVGEGVTLRLSDEVERAFWAPLGPLALGQCDATHDFNRDGTAVSFPAWKIDGQVVWGMTYRALCELLRRIAQAESPT